jgi:DNA primase
VSIEILLSRLNKVKGRNGSWTACCPAHEDKSPSLAIREEGGKVLLHCFGGCAPADVVAAVGMDMTDLFPPRQEQDYAKAANAPRFFAADLLRCIAHEAAIVQIAAYDLAAGKAIPEADRKRLQVAYERINTATELANAHQH